MILIAAATSFTVLMLGPTLLGICRGSGSRNHYVLGAQGARALRTCGRVHQAGGRRCFWVIYRQLLGGMIGWRGVFWVLVPIIVGWLNLA